MAAENKWLYPDTLKCIFACRFYDTGIFLQILYGISDVKRDGFDNNAWLETKKNATETRYAGWIRFWACM